MLADSETGYSQPIFDSSLDPNEDPVTGLERVSSISNLQSAERRHRREQLIRQRQEEAVRQRLSTERHSEHALSEKFESLDYELVENELYRAAERTRTTSRSSSGSRSTGGSSVS